MFIRKIIIVLSIILALLAFNTVFNAIRIDLGSFEDSAERLLEKTEGLIKEAKTFDEKKTLQNLSMNKINGFYYRFDEHVEEAICEDGELRIDNIQEPSGGFSFEFNGDDPVELRPKKGEFVLEGGLLKFKYIEGDYLGSIGKLRIIKEGIDEIELKMKIKKGKEILLGWSRDISAERSDSWKHWHRETVAIYIVPDNEFHVYRINAKNAFIRGGRIRRIFLKLLDASSDGAEIDYIRFIPKKDKYAQKPYGETYETINKEMRKVLYTNTPLGLKYTLNIPEGTPFLKFGMGILDDNDPVKFKVVIKDETEQKEVFSKKIINADAWQDAKLDLSDYSGKSIEILFQTNSAGGNIAFWGNPIIYIPPKEKFNVIILLEDSLRADHMSCYGYSRETTPVKDEFVKKGALFLNAFSQGTVTPASCPSIMTSLYPTATGTWWGSDSLNDKYLTLPEIMRSQGFTTVSFIQNPYAGSYNGIHQGFSSLFDVPEDRAKKIYGKKLYEWIEENIDRNFFLYLHLMDPHSPYNPPEPFDVWYREASLGGIFTTRSSHYDSKWIKKPRLEEKWLLYDGEIRYNDFYFGKFLEKLKKDKLFHNTLIIFIADHGEYLGEHGLWSHIVPGYIQVLHIPMLMVYPAKIPKDVKIIQPVQLADIMPTILDLAGIDKDNFLIQGDSLLSLMRGQNMDFWDNRVCISEEVCTRLKKDNKGEWASIFYKNWHIINSKDLTDRLSKLIKPHSEKLYKRFFTTRVFDYFRDKGEERPYNGFLIDTFFHKKVKSFIRRLQENNMAIWKILTRGTEQVIKYDPEEIERLRALGYLQ